MNDRGLRFYILGMLVLVSAGCSATRDLTLRTYKQDKKRVDMNVDGAVGNWANAPEAVDISEKDTRMMYYFEFTKEPPQREIIYIETPSLSPSPSQAERASRSTSYQIPEDKPRRTIQRQQRVPKYNIPKFEDEEWLDENDSAQTADQVSAMQDSTNFVEYTVQKGDTLQKISKRFYDSYSKWPQIYETNRAKINDPDNIKPGITLRIPKK